MDELERIVRALAALETFHDDLGYAIECRCPDRHHNPECPWRRAREWVDAHPELKPQTFGDMAPGWRL